MPISSGPLRQRIHDKCRWRPCNAKPMTIAIAVRCYGDFECDCEFDWDFDWDDASAPNDCYEDDAFYHWHLPLTPNRTYCPSNCGFPSDSYHSGSCPSTSFNSYQSESIHYTPIQFQISHHFQSHPIAPGLIESGATNTFNANELRFRLTIAKRQFSSHRSSLGIAPWNLPGLQK